MAQSCDANSLTALYAPLQGIPVGAQLPIVIALLCQISGMQQCDAQSLMNLATCDLCGIPIGAQMPIAIALLCQIANNGGSGPGGGVTSIIAGTNVTISPPGGTGAVTINASSGGSGGGIVGTGSPNGAVVGNVGQNYTDTAAQTFWIKETGNATNTGWVQFI